jgi:hypothetical protein
MSIKRMTTNKIRVFWANTASGGQIIDSVSTVTSGVWYYILVRKTLTSTQIYINNTLDKDQTTTGSMGLLPSTSAVIGRYLPTGTRRLNGSVSFIEIFDSAISDPEITELQGYYDTVSDKVTCYNDKSQWYKDNVFSFNRLANYNGNAGEEIDDSSGNGRNLTAFGSIPYNPTGALIVSDGGTQYNTAFASFNGTSHYFTTGNNASASMSQTHTIRTGSSTTGVRRVIDSNYESNTGANDDGGYLIDIQSDGRIRLVLQNNAGVVGSYYSSTVLSPNTEYKVGWSYQNAGAVGVFVDGVKEVTDTFTHGITVNVNHREIGSLRSSEYFFKGSMINARTWNKQVADGDMIEMTSWQTSKSYNNLTNDQKDGLIQDIPFYNHDGFTGQELIDQTGNGNNATNAGSVPFVSELAVECNEAVNILVNSADLNGSSQYFTAGSQFSPTSVSSFSYVVWFKTSTSAQGQMYSSTFEGTGADHWVAVNSTLTGTNKLGFGANDGGAWTASNYVASTSNVNDGQWHLGVGVYDNTANELKIYIDGVLEATTTTVPTPLFSASMLSAVGRYAPSAVAYYDGEMAFVGHAHQALTAGQITTIYNNGVPLCYADLGVTLDGFYNLSNYNGNNGSELTDQVGSNDLTNVGSTPFTGTGLIVECT